MKYHVILKLITITALPFLLSGCLLKVPYSEQKNININKNLIGNWENKIKSRESIYEANISKIDEHTYNFNFYQVNAFVGEPMVFKIQAEGHLYQSGEYLLGQFKVQRFTSVSGDKKEKEAKEFKGLYIIGILENIEENSFTFNWLPDEILSDFDRKAFYMQQKYLTQEKLKKLIDLFLETENFRVKQYQFTKKQ